MPRSSDGNYILPAGTLVNAGDTILPSQHNPAMSDLAGGMTSSLSRDGLGGMRAPLNMGGFPISNVANGTSPSDAANLGQASTPIGAILDFAGSVVPTGYLLCYGQAVSRTTYADLFAALGTVWGPGNGSSTFNVPDLRGLVGAGKDDMGGVSANRIIAVIPSTTLGAIGGAQAHTLSTGEMPAHSHGVVDPGHAHTYAQVAPTGGIAAGTAYGQFTASTGPAQTGISIAQSGGNAPHNNLQPTAIVNKIIKATL